MIDPVLQEVVDTELDILERVRLAVRDAALKQRAAVSQAYARGVIDLREQAASANAADLPALLDYLHSSQQLANRSSTAQALPDLRAPYFAHMQIIDDKSQLRDVLIGHETLIDSQHQISIIDWQTAPLAQVFFLYREGDDFELELPQRRLRGKVGLRRLLSFQMGQLMTIRLGEEEIYRDKQGVWSRRALVQELQGGEGQAVRGFGTGESGQATIEISALLDAQQFRLLSQSDERPVLIIGGAGSGKTTVAVHRLAQLHRKDPQRHPQHHLLFLVPEEGLVRLAKKLLSSLGLDRVNVATYDHWLYQQMTHILPSIRKKVCHQTPPRVMRLKRHEAINAVIPLIRERKFQRLSKTLSKLTSGSLRSAALEFFEYRVDTTLLEQIHDLGRHLRQKVKTPERAVAEIERTLIEQLYDLYSDLLDAYRNKLLLEEIIKQSNGELDAHMIEELYRHTLMQVTPSDGPRSRDVDPSYARTIDDIDIDADYDDDDDVYNSADSEDFTIMANLLRDYTGGGGLWRDLHQYSHIVIDEAQELSANELNLIAQTLEAGSTLTVAGDSAQQNDPSSGFRGWDHTMSALGFAGFAVSELETSYRCPRTIMELAQEVLGPLAPAKKPKTIRDGSPVLWSKASNDGHACTLIMEALEPLLLDEKQASVAIVTNDMDTAKEFYKGLRKIIDCRLIRDGEFDFKPGVDIADVTQVKGLEFDYVIIPDVDYRRYPETAEARRLLHVAMTRAIHQLWVISGQVPSLLLPATFR